VKKGNVSCECWIKRPAYLMKQFSSIEITSTSHCCCGSSALFNDVDSAVLQAAHRCTPAPYGMLTALPTHSFGDADHLVIQIFALHVKCRLVLQWQPHCSTVCKVATAPPLQTKIALQTRVLVCVIRSGVQEG